MHTKYLLIAIFFVVSAAFPAFAQDEVPVCDLDEIEVSSDVSSHINTRQDRIEDLVELMDVVGSDDFEIGTIVDLIYWAAMADSAAQRSEDVVYPDCSQFKLLDDTYHLVIDHVYAISSQTILLLSDELSDFQRENVLAILEDRIGSLTLDLALWGASYQVLMGEQ